MFQGQFLSAGKDTLKFVLDHKSYEELLVNMRTEAAAALEQQMNPNRELTVNEVLGLSHIAYGMMLIKHPEITTMPVEQRRGLEDDQHLTIALAEAALSGSPAAIRVLEAYEDAYSYGRKNKAK